MQYQLRWAGHVVRMPDERLPKRLFYGELQEGKRSQGGQRKRFKDTLKASLKSFGIDPSGWESIAQDRNKGRSNLLKGSASSEKNRTAAAEKRREDRKARADAPRASQDISIPCPHCERTFRAQIGLISHLRCKH